MDETPNDQTNSKMYTVEGILHDWLDNMDLQNVTDYPPKDLYCIACARIVVETPTEADDDIYWTAVEYVYNMERRNYLAELKDQEADPSLQSNSSYVEYMKYEETAIKVLKERLDEWSQHEFGTPYEDKND